jgi:hypothetical protein
LDSEKSRQWRMRGKRPRSHGRRNGEEVAEEVEEGLLRQGEGLVGGDVGEQGGAVR